MFHWQNLNDGKKPRRGGGLRHGRAWWGELGCEWSFFWGKACHLSFSRRGLSLALVFFSLSLRYGERDGREFRVAIHNNAAWLNVWSDPMGGWSREQPWIEGTHVFHFDNFLLGRAKHTLVEGETHNVLIPMPEGCYRAKVTFETRMWKRPRWFAFVRRCCDIKIPGGIP